MPTTTGWWNDFFSGLAVEFWRRAVPEELTIQEADFLEQHLDATPGARLLDVPCGDGRLSLELADRGYDLTGVDISTEFLALASRTAQQRGLTVAWRQADMRDLPADGSFDGAFCFGNSFGYLDDEGNLDFLRAVHAALRPGARFVIDSHMIAEVLFPQFEPEFEVDVDGLRALLSSRYEPAEGRTYTDYTFELDDQTERRSSIHRVYTCRQILDLLSFAGFTDPILSGGLEGEPFEVGSSKLLVVATRA